MLTRNRLYLLLLLACSVGYIWLFLIFEGFQSANADFEVCIIKRALNIPCPSCGSTRALNNIVNGNFYEALRINPIGYVLAMIMSVAPLWVCLDLIRRENSFFNIYLKMEAQIRKPKFYLPLIAIILLNWIWNFYKGL